MDGPEVGNILAIKWGSGCCKAEILSETEGRYLLKLDFGILEIMDISELKRRSYVILPKKVPFWERWRKP